MTNELATAESASCASVLPASPAAATDPRHGDGIRREIHTYVMRSGHMTEREKRNYALLHDRYCIPFAESPLDYAAVFGNNNPVVIEIGFGMGTATAIIADERRAINYIGIEVHKAGVGRLLGEIEARKLSNLRIIEYDAMEVLRAQVPDGSVSAFHIFFADPWPKKKHHKRRLVQRPRTDLLSRKLISGGYLYFVTDWLPYAEFALGELTATDGLHNRYDGFAPHQAWRPETRFEQKGRDANRVISELLFERV